MTSRVAWAPRRSAPDLGTGEVHFWCASIDGLLGNAVAWRAQLAGEELDRADRFHFERDAARYVVCRATLRQLLASYLGADDVRGVALSYGPHGKPALASDSGAHELRFNLAHTGGFALFGFARSVELGVDVERVHDIPDLDTLMRSCFAAGERAEIGALTPDEQRAAFFRCWTRKEAVLKALGSGLARELDSFEVSIAERQARLLRMTGEDHADRWQVLHLDPAPGYTGAAAWAGAPRSADFFSYEP